MEKGKYLERINYRGEGTPGLDTLTQLQQQHLLHVPFENLDIHLKVPIELDAEKIFYKIVEKKRGGFCYELNGLFHLLLLAMGFESKMISARVYNREKGFSQEYDHMALIVQIDETDMLVDTGFGEFVFSPLKIITGVAQDDKRGRFRITNYGIDWLQVSKESGGEWVPEYVFTTNPRSLSEFEEMCRYHQSSPESHFTKNRICSILTNQGNDRVTLSGNKLKLTRGKEITEKEIASDADFEKYLWEYFKMKI